MKYSMKHWKKWPSLTVWLVLALLVLLPLLAFWQYRWLGEIGVAERERMQRNLKASAAQFGQEFDREVTHAYLSLQEPLLHIGQTPRASFAERYQRWAAEATHPRLIRVVYQLELDEKGAAQPWQFNPARGQFEITEWTPALRMVEQGLAEHRLARAHAQTLLRDVVKLPRVLPPLLPDNKTAQPVEKNQQATVIQVTTPGPVDERLPGLVIPLNAPPLASFGPGARQICRVVLFDADYIKQELLPGLARKHFASQGVNEFNVAVLQNNKPNGSNDAPVIYASDPLLAQKGAALAASSDAAEHFFRVRLDARDRILFNLNRERGENQPNNPKGTALSIGIVSNEVRLSKVSGAKESAEGMAWQFQQSADGAWQVVLNHRAGSLEAAVAKVRRRNLALSFGILLLLGVSVGLIVLSSRRAQALAARQIEFVAGVSHELRTPLTVICSAAENLADGVVEDREQIKSYGALIRAEGRRLTGMVEQVLEFAGAQSGRQAYELRPVAPEQVIEAALAALRLSIQEQGFVVEKQLAAELPLLKADSDALSRALQNLLSNALKYSGDNRWLAVRAQTAKTLGGEELRLSVADRGLGIAPEELAQIFEPFYRSQTVTAAQIHGNGLGLSLVKHIVEAHGGRVSVESKIGQGSTFTLHLPVLREAATAASVLVSEYEQAPSTR